VGSLAAGLLGSLTGLGGGVVIIPLLTLVFKVDIHYAIGASLISVIATSSGAAAAYVREGISNIRLGMFLEVATTAGAVGGAFLATYLSTSIIAIVFGIVLIVSAVLSFAKAGGQPGDGAREPVDPAIEAEWHLCRPRRADNLIRKKCGRRFPDDECGRGDLGLLGIGSGALKVMAMDNIMRTPSRYPPRPAIL
jgi:uncharacterized membrane protein YfcA